MIHPTVTQRITMLICAWVALAAMVIHAETSFTLVALGHLGGGSSRASAINNLNWVVGESDSASGEVKAFLWIPASGMRSLGTLGGENSRAHDINDDGLVVGESSNSNGVAQAFAWSEATGMTALPVPEGTVYSAAIAVNARGQIAGSLENETGSHAVLWEGTNRILLHRLPGSGIIQPLAINDRGDVAGQINLGADAHSAGLAFYFRGGASAINLAEFRLISAQSGSSAVALNQQGVAAGYLMLDSARVRAFRYDPTREFETLHHRDALFTTASDINDAGITVGSWVASYDADEAACWWPESTLEDLNGSTTMPPDWSLIQALGINNRNAITGYGLHDESVEAFLLLPAESATVPPAD